MKLYEVKKENNKKKEVTSNSGFITRIQPISFIKEGEANLVYSDAYSVSGFAVDFSSEMNRKIKNHWDEVYTPNDIFLNKKRISSSANAISNHILSEALSSFFNIINYVIEDSSLVITSKELSGMLFHQIKQTTSKLFYNEEFRTVIYDMVCSLLNHYYYNNPDNLPDYIGANATQVASYLITETCKAIEMSIANIAVVYDDSSSHMLDGFLQDKTFMKFYKDEFLETNLIGALCQYIRMSLYFVMDHYVANMYLVICNQAITYMIMNMNLPAIKSDEDLYN